MIKYCTACLAALVLTLCFPGVSLAHRVNIFAYADQGAIQVECYFSKSQKVRHGKLTVTDLETGATLLEGVTDEQGMFRFRPADDFLKTGHGIAILLNAGEGHQAARKISPEELKTLSPAAQAAQSANDGQQPFTVPAADQAVTPLAAVALSPADTAELEALIGKVMDAKLAPIKQALARQEDRAPDFRDIIGGIGWILGLLGMAAYVKYRR